MLKRETGSLFELAVDVKSFLAADSSAINIIHREIIDDLRKLGRIYVVGGLVRDLAMYGQIERPNSDIDLVVRCNQATLRKFAESIGAVANRFGGFAGRSHAYRVDFWAFQNTWAKTEGHVRLRGPGDLWRTTFFDWDAVVYGLEENQIWAIDNYLDRIKSGVLDINLLPNPSPMGSLVRALRRLMMWDAKPSPRLRSFIDSHLRAYHWADIVRAESGAFYTQYLDEFEQADDYRNSVLSRALYERMGIQRGRQPAIPGFENLPAKTVMKKLADEVTISKVNFKGKPRRNRFLSKDLFGRMR